MEQEFQDIAYGKAESLERGRGMTREFIENYREILIPFMKKWLSETNYENLGESDAEEFEKDFNEICDLAIKALEQESKIKVLDSDEVARKLGTVDIYKASAWATLLKDLEYLGMKICEVEE